jgi:FlgD Ig-like domain
VRAWSVSCQGLGDLRTSALVVSGSILYVGGNFTSIGGHARNNIAALDVATGDVTTWHPNLQLGSTAQLGPYAAATLAVSGSTVYVGGFFTAVDGFPQSYFAALSNPTTPTAILAFHAEPFEDGVRIVWELSDPSAFSSVALERATASTGPWTELSAELSREGESTVALDRSAEAGQTYFYRLVAQSTNGSQVVFGPVSASRGEPLTTSGLTFRSPNPTPGGFQVQYSVARAGQVRLELLDVSGRIVATLADRAQQPGRYEAAWDGVGPRGQLPPGLYFVRFTAPDRMTVTKLAVVR